jgi:peptidylprolyl isomerase
MAPRNRKAHKKPVKTEKLETRQGNKSVLIALGVIAVLIIVFAAVAAFNPTWSPSNASATPTPAASPTPTPIHSSEDPYAGAKMVLLHTSMGDITVALRNDMPITTGNFINLVNEGVYNGSSFHRIVDGFMIQGGQPAENGYSPTDIPSIQDEFTDTNHNYNGTIAMAKTNLPNSATSQFFINVADNNNRYAEFDSTYSAFGKVVSGMDVVMAISQVETSGETPVNPVFIIGAKVVA